MPHEDKYPNFRKLSDHEQVGVDYRIRVLDQDARDSRVVVLAPHGGGIEPHTSRIAEEVAGSEFFLYLFEGLKAGGNFDALHITSSNFDEPKCVHLVQHAQIAVAVHGKAGQDQAVRVGGRDEELGARMIAKLVEAGFDASRETEPRLAGKSTSNICNRTETQKGVQLEITRGLRCRLIDDLSGELSAFSDALRQAVFEDERL